MNDYVPSSVYVGRQAVFLGGQEIKASLDADAAEKMTDRDAQQHAARAQEKLLAILLAEAGTHGRDAVSVGELIQLRHTLVDLTR